MPRRKPLLDSPETIEGVARRWVLLAGGVLFFVIFLSLAGNAWAMGIYRLLGDGSLCLVWLAACGGIGYWLLRPFRESTLVSCIALGIGVFSILLLLLGLIGGLNRASAWTLIAIGIVAAVPAVRRSKKATERIGPWFQQIIPYSDWLWLLVVPLLAIATVAAFVPPGLLWGAEEPNGYDVVEYHLQVPREWFDLGRIVPLHHNVFSYFPFNVEVHYLWAMHLRGGPWAGMYLAQLMHLAMVVLSVAAIYKFVGRGGLPAVLLAAAAPWLIMVGSIAYNEGGVLLFGVLTVGLAMQALDRPADRSRLMALAGVFAGFACGCKLTAAPMLLVLLPLAFAFAMALKRDFKFAKPVVLFLIFGVAAFSPWLIRNFIWTHNPVFPEEMSLFGKGPFTQEQMTRWQMAYVPPQHDLAHRVAAIGPQILLDWRFGFALFPALFLFVVELLRRRASFDKAVAFLFALLVAWLILWTGFTHLQGRFFVPAIPVVALLIARISGPIARLAVVCALLLEIGVGLVNLTPRVFHLADAIGIENYSLLDESFKTADETRGNVCLLGDARAFFYQVPSKRLYYRTVFDVNVDGRSIIEAWTDGWPANSYVVYSLGELERFHKTYCAIPAPPAPATSPTEKD